MLCFVFFLIVLQTTWLYGQGEDAVSSLLSSSDKSKTEKANQYKSQGDGLIEEASQLYMETFSVQADYQLDDKSKTKKVDQLELKAQQKQFEAFELYRKCNETKYAIYKKYIEKFWADFSGNESPYINAKLIEEQSNDYFYQATTMRNDAGKLKDRKEKIQKLNDANNLDIRAIEKQITALGLYYSLEEQPLQAATTKPQQPVNQPSYPETSPVYTPDVPSPAYTATHAKPASGDAQVNQEMIEMYRQYIGKSIEAGNNFLTPELLQGINSFNADQILSIWYNYAFGQSYTPEYAEQLLAEEKSVITEQPVEDFSAEQYQQYQAISVEQKAIETKEAAQTELKLAEIHSGEEGKLKLLPSDEIVIYRVQLTANKAELNQRALQKIYYGNKQLEMIMEDGWFKYSIGDFDDFKSADKFRSQCGVNNAFIVAYRKGTMFTTPSGQEQEMSAQRSTTYAVFPDAEGLMFRVQVAASHSALNKEQLARIYGGAYPVEMIEEDGWYKYQILGVRLFSDALKIIRDARVKGAFISAYNNNEKTDLLGAVNISKKIEKEIQTYGRRGKVNDVEYHVQVTASKIPLRSDELSRIYSGNYVTALIFEDGWYKYRIKAGSSYEDAERIKNNSGVSKAFVVAYDRAVKVPLFQAREKSKQNN